MAVLGLLGCIGKIGTQAAHTIPIETPKPPVTSWEVVLTWDAPLVSPDPVATYTVYRSLPGENFIFRLQAGITDTTYTDTDVASGHTYDYFVVSVDSAGVESVSSNIAEVTVP